VPSEIELGNALGDRLEQKSSRGRKERKNWRMELKSNQVLGPFATVNKKWSYVNNCPHAISSDIVRQLQPFTIFPT
jgi:hypothetical protein